MKRTRSQASRYAVAKGKDYERRIAKVLSKWWGSTLHRTPTSGVNIYSGDIVDDKGEFPFIVECKKDEDWSFGNLLEETQNKQTLRGFWKQSLNDWLETDPHHRENDPRLVVFSKRSVKDYFMIATGWFELLKEYCGPYSGSYLKAWIYPDHVVIGKLADFLDHFSSNMIRTIPEWRRE